MSFYPGGRHWQSSAKEAPVRLSISQGLQSRGGANHLGDWKASSFCCVLFLFLTLCCFGTFQLINPPTTNYRILNTNKCTLERQWRWAGDPVQPAQGFKLTSAALKLPRQLVHAKLVAWLVLETGHIVSIQKTPELYKTVYATIILTTEMKSSNQLSLVNKL